MASETVTVALSRPIKVHGDTGIVEIKEVVLKEPNFDDYMSIGDPWTVAGTRDGNAFGVENIDVIKQYLAVCLVTPKDPAALEQATARDARKIKDKLLGFFRDAEGKAEA